MLMFIQGELHRLYGGGGGRVRRRGQEDARGEDEAPRAGQSVSSSIHSDNNGERPYTVFHLLVVDVACVLFLAHAG